VIPVINARIYIYPFQLQFGISRPDYLPYNSRYYTLPTGNRPVCTLLRSYVQRLAMLKGVALLD
jgi:hypothetical protein